MSKFFWLLLISFFLFSCASKPLKEFVLSDGMALQLFSDATYIQEVRLLERKYTVKGTWSGKITEGSFFTTISEAEGLKKMTTSTYQVLDGKAKLIDN